MGRNKRTEEDQVESLERQLRELKSINRSLMRRLKNVSRGYRKYLSKDVDEPEEPKREAQKICYDCGRGTMDIKIILNRRWRECSVCGKRTSTKMVNPDGSVGPKTAQK
jgi:hypothetical protein